MRRRVVVSGRVQGVWFRQSCADQARARGVTGWVRNRGDGAVEAVLEGPEAAVEAVVAWCRMGPPHASVEHVSRCRPRRRSGKPAFERADREIAPREPGAASLRSDSGERGPTGCSSSHSPSRGSSRLPTGPPSSSSRGLRSSSDPTGPGSRTSSTRSRGCSVPRARARCAAARWTTSSLPAHPVAPRSAGPRCHSRSTTPRACSRSSSRSSRSRARSFARATPSTS